jgi:hypothetical protein
VRHSCQVAPLTFCAAIALSVPSHALAQITGTPTPVAVFAPVDAVALGVTRAASIGVFAADYQVVIGADTGLAGGALRLFVGATSDMWSAGAGYAHTIVTHQLTNSLCVGSTLCTAYRTGSAHSAGIGAGSRLSFGQFAIELMARDVVGANFQHLYIGYAALGASLRL